MRQTGPLEKATLRRILREFKRNRGTAYGIIALGFFGSYARGEAGAGSDVDIVYRLAPETRQTLLDLALLREDLMQTLGRSVDLIEMRERLEPRLKRRIQEEADYV